MPALFVQRASTRNVFVVRPGYVFVSDELFVAPATHAPAAPPVVSRHSQLEDLSVTPLTVSV